MDFIKNELVVNWSVFPRLFIGFSLHKTWVNRKMKPVYNLYNLYITFSIETSESTGWSNHSFFENDHGHNKTYHCSETNLVCGIIQNSFIESWNVSNYGVLHLDCW